MPPMQRSASAPLRSRYSSVLESALVGLGREDAVVLSTRKPRRKRPQNEAQSPFPALHQTFSAPVRPPQAAGEEEDPFAHLQLVRKKRKKERGLGVSPAVTRSVKRKHRLHAGVLEMTGRTPVTRSKTKKRLERISLEDVEELEEVVVQKKLLFQSPEVKKENKMLNKMLKERTNRKALVLTQWTPEWPPVLVGDRDAEKAKLVLTGQVDGLQASFVLAKREGPTKFTSDKNEYVALSGTLDRDAARGAGMPRAAMELMQDGIPAYFSKRLLPFVRKEGNAGKETVSGLKRKKMNKARGVKKKCSPTSSIGEYSESEPEAEAPLSPLQDDDIVDTSKPKKTRAPVPKKEKKSKGKKEQSEPEAAADVWTAEQLEALSDAKMTVPTVASNFWAQVAQFVPGKSAKDCQTKTFEQFRSPPMNRKAAKKPIKRANTESKSEVSAKIARAGSNKFKKQVREFVEEYEKKHVDDLFDTTPSKEGLPELPEFDSIKSPELATPSRSFDDDDSDNDDEAPGLLKKLSSRRRDDIDSYVLGINRQHVAGGGVMARGKVRRVTTIGTPISTAKTNAMSAKAVMLEEECGSHSLKGVVSPGGTTHIRVEKDGSSSEEEDDDEYHSEDEEDFDLP